MIGIQNLLDAIIKREQTESPHLKIGDKWQGKNGNILVECEPLKWDEWDNITPEQQSEIDLLPTNEMREELSGYKIRFKPHYGRAIRVTNSPVCLVDGHCTRDMIFDALLRSIKYADKYPKWVPDATFLRSSWVRNGVYVGIQTQHVDPLTLYMQSMFGGLTHNGRRIPNNLLSVSRQYAN